MGKSLKNAKNYCEEHKYRFTEPRKRVLRTLLNCKKPMGAYEILKVLSTEQHQVKPATIYRAIDFWQEHGFIHKINSSNSYITCSHGHSHDHSFIAICDWCSESFELSADGLPAIVTQALQENHFLLNQSATELHGKCKQCKGNS